MQQTSSVLYPELNVLEKKISCKIWRWCRIDFCPSEWNFNAAIVFCLSMDVPATYVVLLFLQIFIFITLFFSPLYPVSSASNPTDSEIQTRTPYKLSSRTPEQCRLNETWTHGSWMPDAASADVSAVNSRFVHWLMFFGVGKCNLDIPHTSVCLRRQ